MLKGIDSLKWYLRNKLHISNNGMPPEMKYHQLGLGSEITIIKPELQERIKSLISIAEKSGEYFYYYTLFQKVNSVLKGC